MVTPRRGAATHGTTVKLPTNPKFTRPLCPPQGNMTTYVESFNGWPKSTTAVRASKTSLFSPSSLDQKQRSQHATSLPVPERQFLTRHRAPMATILTIFPLPPFQNRLSCTHHVPYHTGASKYVPMYTTSKWHPSQLHTVFLVRNTHDRHRCPISP
jgi:hypothetical protein